MYIQRKQPLAHYTWQFHDFLPFSRCLLSGEEVKQLYNKGGPESYESSEMLLVDIAVNLAMQLSFLFFSSAVTSILSISYFSFNFLSSNLSYCMHRPCRPSQYYGNRGYYMTAQRYKTSLWLLKNIILSQVSTWEEKFGLSKWSCNVLCII